MISRLIAFGLVLSVAAPAAGDELNPAEKKVGAVLFQNVCAQCHGPKGEGNELLKSPSIASLPAWYVKIQMANFREGRRGHDPADTAGMLMAAISKTLDPAHLKAVAAHVETMERVRPKVAGPDPGLNLTEGRLLFEERCMECHRYNATGELVFGSAPLIGLQQWYLEGQLRKFKNGQRGAMKGDQNGAKMVNSSQFIETDKALREVVAYIMTLNEAASRPVIDPFDAAARDSAEN